MCSNEINILGLLSSLLKSLLILIEVSGVTIPWSLISLTNKDVVPENQIFMNQFLEGIIEILPVSVNLELMWEKIISILYSSNIFTMLKHNG